MSKGFIEILENNLEKICEYIDRCAESDYGSLEICKDYFRCSRYWKYTEERLRNQIDWQEPNNYD